MSGQQFTLFKGTLAGDTAVYTDPIDVSFARYLTLRGRYISGLGTTKSITVTLETSPSPGRDDSDWATFTSSIAPADGSEIDQETYAIAAGVTAVAAWSSHVRAKLVLGSSDAVITAEVHLIARD